MGCIQSVNAMLWDDRLVEISLMVRSPLLLPLDLSGIFIVSSHGARKARGGPGMTDL